jgi:hypothetical protein
MNPNFTSTTHTNPHNIPRASGSVLAAKAHQLRQTNLETVSESDRGDFLHLFLSLSVDGSIRPPKEFQEKSSRID